MERYNDQVMQLYNDTNTIYWDDDDLLEIVSEQAQAYFAGGPVACGNGGTDPGPGRAVSKNRKSTPLNSTHTSAGRMHS